MIESVTIKVEQCDSVEHAREELYRATHAAWAPEMEETREVASPAELPRLETKALVIELEPQHGFKGRQVTEAVMD